MEKESDRFWGKNGLRLFLILLALAGAYFVGVFEEAGKYPSKFGEHLAMAVTISGIIGLIIEYTLQREITKNVFRAAIGYLLPEELREELRWIYNLPFLCENHVQTVRLEKIEGSTLIKVRCEVTRTIKNITDSTQACAMGLGVDDWFYGEQPSKIISYTYQKDGEKKSDNLAQYTVRENAAIHLGKDKKLTPDVPVSSGKKITISFEYEETRQENDLSFIHFGGPTANTYVTVFAPESLKVEVAFSHRKNDPKIVKVGEHTWQLNATLLPLQAIRVVWHRKDTYEAWDKSITQQA